MEVQFEFQKTSGTAGTKFIKFSSSINKFQKIWTKFCWSSKKWSGLQEKSKKFADVISVSTLGLKVESSGCFGESLIDCTRKDEMRKQTESTNIDRNCCLNCWNGINPNWSSFVSTGRQNMYLSSPMVLSSTPGMMNSNSTEEYSCQTSFF